MVRVLHVVGTMNRGGIETMLMNFYRNIDRDKIQFDFAVHGSGIGEYEPEIRALGGRIYHVRSKSESFLGNLADLTRVVKENHYNIVEVHQDAMSMFALRCAKKGGASVRIAHAHSTSMPPSRLGKIVYPYALKRTLRYTTDKFSCSRKSAEYLFQGNVAGTHYIYNGIETERFRFSESAREKIRQMYELGDAFVLGQVGNFLHPKNQLFTLEVFRELLKMNPQARLVFCGAGKDMEACRQRASDLGILQAIVFAGNVDNVHEMLSAFDALILPSFYEGFPVSVIEGQCSGLSCFVSDTITQETKITDRIHYCSLKAAPRVWAQEILGVPDTDRHAYADQVKQAGFDIGSVIHKLQEFYLEAARRNGGDGQRPRESSCNGQA